MVYWNSRGSSCELISTQSPLICTSSGMIIGRSSLLIHHDVDINLYYVHISFYLYQSYISHFFYSSSGLAIGHHESPLLIWCLFPQTIYKDFLSWTTTLIAFMKFTPLFVVIDTGNLSIVSHSYSSCTFWQQF